MKSTATLAALALLAACASTPPAPAPAAPTAAAKPLNGNPVRSAIAPASDDEKEIAKFARMQGYRLQKRDDRVMWCKRVAEIGSKIEHNDCVSDQTIADMRRVYDANKQELMNALQGCNGGSACSSK